MNDEDMLAAMRRSLTSSRDSLTHVHMTRPPEAITARARARRLRRGLSGAGAAGTALGVGLALALSGGQAAPRSVHVNLDAWSVNTTSAGLVDITIRELQDPARLRQALADAGVPAVVTFGELCTTRSGSLPDIAQVLSKPREGGDVAFTIDPAAMPAGTEFTAGLKEGITKQGKPGLLTAWFGLIKKGSRLTCGVPGSGSEAKPGAPKAGARAASTKAGSGK